MMLSAQTSVTAKPEPFVNGGSPNSSHCRPTEQICGQTPSPAIEISPTTRCTTTGTNTFCQVSRSQISNAGSDLGDVAPSPIRNPAGAWSYHQPANDFSACYPLDVKVSLPSLINGDYSQIPATSSMFASDSAITDAYADVHQATKSLLHSTPLSGQYYGSGMYNGQPLAYGMQGAGNFYGSQSQQSYYAASRALKGASPSIPASYPLNPYFAAQTAAAPYYGTNYGTGQGLTGQPLDYTATYATAAYPAQYYGTSYAAYTGNVATTTTTYQLAQLPPCTTLAGTADSGTSANNPNPISDLASPFAKSETKKSKSKKKKPANPSPSPECEFERVFIWDLDETCLLFHSLLSGAYAAKFHKDAATCVTLGLRMEELIFGLVESNLFLSDLEDCDQVHIDDIGVDESGHDLTGYNFTGDGFQLTPGGAPLCLSSSGGMRGGVDWMRKLAFRYRRIRDLYSLYKDNVTGLLGAKAEPWMQLRSDIETLTDSWHSLALKCLAVISSRSRYANVLVSNTHLVPSVAKTLLYGLGPVFPIENIYSAAKIGREACLDRVLNRFGKKCTYVVVGSGRDEESVAKQMQLPFWRVSTHSDLAALHHALDLGHL